MPPPRIRVSIGPTDGKGSMAIRVLVAEDEPGVRAFVTRGLEHAGYEVTAVSDGQQALEALEEGGFDLLVADIVMPVLDGIALALCAVKRRPGLRVLLITGYSVERRRALNLEALIDGVLEKPFSLAQLLRAAGSAVGGGVGMAGAGAASRSIPS